MFTRAALSVALATVFSVPVIASEPPIQGYGQFYQVQGHDPIAAQTHFKIAYDVADQAEAGKLNFRINSLARFINMHVDAGVKPEQIELALVVHGGASQDLLANAFYKEKFDADNENQALIEQLLANNTKVFLCGQSAAYYKVDKAKLIPGVTLSLSAMTAHAQLQQQGYSLNPF